MMLPFNVEISFNRQSLNPQGVPIRLDGYPVVKDHVQFWHHAALSAIIIRRV